jgi:AraC-like DNA-binding protein/quercetin dioxygenase-like cupin family protein
MIVTVVSIERQQFSLAHIQSLIRVSRFAARPGARPIGRFIESGYEEIELITGGQATFHDGEKHYQLQAGSMLWHQAGEQTVYDSNPEDPYRCLVLCFVVAHTGMRSAPRVSRWENFQSALLFADHIERVFHRQDVDQGFLCHFAATTCGWHAQTGNHQAHDPTLPTTVAAALQVINRDFSKDISVADIAAAAGVSVPHLHDLFRRYVESSPHQVLLGRRMQHARWLLANSSDSIAEIARLCGYSLTGSFCRAFGQQQKASPTAYRSMYATPKIYA